MHFDTPIVLRMPEIPANAYIESQERRLREVIDVLRDVCLLPAPGTAGHRAVLVLNESVLVASQVPLLHARLTEELRLKSVSIEGATTVEDWIDVKGPLPRTPEGRLDRAAITRLAEDVLERRFTPGMTTCATWSAFLEANPTGASFQAKIGQAVETPLHPAHDLERDLGLDSLRQIELVEMARNRFGAQIGPGELWRLRTVEDWVRCVVSTAGPIPPETETADKSWASRVREQGHDPIMERLPNPRPFGAKIWFRALCLLLRAYSRVIHGTQLVGGDKLTRSGPVILCPTHVSLIDSILCYPTLPTPVIDQLYFIAFGEYFQQPATSWLTTAGRLIHTGTVDDNLDALREGFQVLEAGAKLLIFPEGVRTYHQQLEPMHPRLGAGILACETQTPIIPMIFDGSEGTLSAPHPGLHRCKVRIVVGDPIHPPDRPCTMDDYRTVMDAWLEAVRKMRRQQHG